MTNQLTISKLDFKLRQTCVRQLDEDPMMISIQSTPEPSKSNNAVNSSRKMTMQLYMEEELETFENPVDRQTYVRQTIEFQTEHELVDFVRRYRQIERRTDLLLRVNEFTTIGTTLIITSKKFNPLSDRPLSKDLCRFIGKLINAKYLQQSRYGISSLIIEHLIEYSDGSIHLNVYALLQNGNLLVEVLKICNQASHLENFALRQLVSAVIAKDLQSIIKFSPPDEHWHLLQLMLIKQF